ncbi:mmpL11, partial [Symbiodinium microadriaticum]
MSESTLMALTFDYSLFLLVRFQEELALGAGLMQAVSASIRRSGHVILGSGLTLCYCSLAVQQLPLEESHSLSIGILMAILCAMSVNMFVTPVV